MPGYGVARDRAREGLAVRAASGPVTPAGPRWYPSIDDRHRLPLANPIATRQKAVTFTVQRGFRLPSFSVCSSLLWGMALLSLCLLPTDYRAGAETAHAHSLFQLWLDAADGGVFHVHARQLAATDAFAGTVSWFDPTFAPEGQVQHSAAAQNPDLAHQHDSAPAVSGIDLLLASLAFVPLLSGASEPAPGVIRRLVGRSPQVLPPPPRYLRATV